MVVLWGDVPYRLVEAEGVIYAEGRSGAGGSRSSR
jgi:hypothetical protein